MDDANEGIEKENPGLKRVLPKDYALAYANGTTVNMLPADGFKRSRLALPPIERIRRFMEFVTPLIDKAEANYEESRSLTVTRDALLPKLLSGEVTPN